MTPMETFLTDLVKTPEQNAKFVNTLSLLEYIGARKILKSQLVLSVTFDVLAHASEEIRHAQTLKKLALKMSQGKLTSYAEPHLFCGAAASRYFQTLDHKAAEIIGSESPWANYLITTLLIEERANSVYPIYESLLADKGWGGTFRAIIREEASHLADVTEALDALELTRDQYQRLRVLEESAFNEFVDTLRQSLDQTYSTTLMPSLSEHPMV